MLEIIDLETKERKIPQVLSKPRRWSSNDYLDRLTRIGCELGNPSMTLIRKDAFEMDERAWKTNISADYIMHVIVPTKGDVVIIPAGSVLLYSHKNQDSQTVNFAITVQRMANTLNYLAEYPNKKVKQHAHLVAVIESFGFIIYARGNIKRKKNYIRDFGVIG